jgi:hypothetical protein
LVYHGQDGHIYELFLEALRANTWAYDELLVRYLGLQEQPQQQSEWCWAATTVSITLYYDPTSTWTQCSLANHVFGQTTCCQNGGSAMCNRGSDCGADLSTTNHLSSELAAPIPLTTIMQEIDALRPIAIAITWNGGGQHFVTIDGYDASDPTAPTIDVQDPAYGRSANQDFNTFPATYQGGATWNWTYLTK